MESRIDQLFAVSDTYCAATKRSESRVSTMIFNHGNRMKNLREGKDMGVRILEGAFQWFSDHWPSDAVWPSSVPRPVAGGPLASADTAISSSSVFVAEQEKSTNENASAVKVHTENVNAHG